MKRATVALVALAFMSTGCGPENQDPRNGVVVIDSENCFAGCFEITKVCIGPDLVWRDSRLSAENRELVIADAPECEPR